MWIKYPVIYSKESNALKFLYGVLILKVISRKDSLRFIKYHSKNYILLWRKLTELWCF